MADDDSPRREFEPPRYHRILVALDDSAAAEFACRHAVATAIEQHSRITLLTVVPSPAISVAASGIAPQQLLAEMQADAGTRLQALAAGLPEALSVTTVVREGPPAEEILAMLGEEPFDLVCMGARGRGCLATTLLGSVSAAVVHRSPVPVMVFHPPPE